MTKCIFPFSSHVIIWTIIFCVRFATCLILAVAWCQPISSYCPGCWWWCWCSCLQKAMLKMRLRWFLRWWFQHGVVQIGLGLCPTSAPLVPHPLSAVRLPSLDWRWKEHMYVYIVHLSPIDFEAIQIVTDSFYVLNKWEQIRETHTSAQGYYTLRTAS